MAVRLLKEVIRTKYITDEHTKRLRDILSVVPTTDTVDLADCKFTPGAERVLREFYGKVDFCNSKDVKLDRILNHNKLARSPFSQPENVMDLPAGILSQSEVIDLFKNIDKTKIYRLGDMDNQPMKKISLTILLMMKFPEIMFDLEVHAARLFDRVRNDWLKYREHHQFYFEVNKTAIIRHEVVDGYVDYTGVGRIKEDKFVTSYNVLPEEFGSKMLYGNPEFQEVWDNALENLCKSMDTVKIMRDYIEVIE